MKDLDKTVSYLLSMKDSDKTVSYLLSMKDSDKTVSYPLSMKDSDKTVTYLLNMKDSDKTVSKSKSQVREKQAGRQTESACAYSSLMCQISCFLEYMSQSLKALPKSCSVIVHKVQVGFKLTIHF